MRNYLLGKEQRVEPSGLSRGRRKGTYKGFEMRGNSNEQKEGPCLLSREAQHELTLKRQRGARP